MNLQTYEKTRYQNIYRHKKNRNYLIMISKPTKTSISKVDNKKIFKIEDALKIRDNPKIKLQKGNEAKYKDEFDDVWFKYIDVCKKQKQLAFKTIAKKEQLYSNYFKGNLKKKLSKITKEDIYNFIFNLDTTNKQKNEILKILKAFFNWCIEEDYLIVSPALKIKPYKIEKTEMKYWTPEEIGNFFKTVNYDINNGINVCVARRVKIFTLLEFSLGDRVGETRALTYDCFDEKRGIVRIKHSINYDRTSNVFLSNTKNYHSQREVDITPRVINEVKEYKKFLLENTEYNISDNNLIFFNYNTKKPYSDTKLRKDFYKYCEKANVTKIRMYDLRHTYVAIMMSEGKELYLISPRIGHKNYSTTVNKYGHLSSKTRKEVAEITDKYI